MIFNYDCNISLMLILCVGVSDFGLFWSFSQYIYGWEVLCWDGLVYLYFMVFLLVFECFWCSGFCLYFIDFYLFLECGCGFCLFFFIFCINFNDFGVF